MPKLYDRLAIQGYPGNAAEALVFTDPALLEIVCDVLDAASARADRATVCDDCAPYKEVPLAVSPDDYANPPKWAFGNLEPASTCNCYENKSDGECKHTRAMNAANAAKPVSAEDYAALFREHQAALATVHALKIANDELRDFLKGRW